MIDAGPTQRETSAATLERGRRPSRQIEGLAAGTPAAQAARLVVGARLQEFAKRASTAVEEVETPERVRQVRVAARRALTALRLFERMLEEREARRVRRRVNRVRRAAGLVRDADVFLGLLEPLLSKAVELRPPGTALVAQWLRKERAHRADQLVQAIDRDLAGFDRLTRRLLHSIREEGLAPDADAAANGEAGTPTSLRDLVGPRLLELAREARGRAESLPAETEPLHELRLACKRVRYTMEIAAPCLPGALRDQAYDSLVQVQDHLAPVSDLAEFVPRLRRMARRHAARLDEGETDPVSDGLFDLHERYKTAHESRVVDAAAYVRESGVAALARLEEETAIVFGETRPRPAPEPPLVVVTARPAVGQLPRTGAARPLPEGPHRMAVIDIGTNSVRVEIVEAFPDRSYRVLDDEKETTRLGSGILRTGVLSPEAMERTAAAVTRMASIAAGYGVKREWVRAVGTFAVREAANREQFLGMVQERAGLEVAALSPEQEGKLAFLSAERLMDLSAGTSAVVDIGGGSTEIVLSAAGVPEQIYGLPLGAMLLTEEFGGPTESGRGRFREMRRRIDRVMRREVGRPLLRPQVVVGTGGTFGVLASALAEADGGTGPKLWDRRVGFEASRSEIAHLLQRLRRMSPQERAEVPGVPADRADIIVAGFAIVERALKRLGANSVRIHDRGIRDGMVHAMVAEAFPSGMAEPGPMGAVRRLAQKCNYEEGHSEHVTRLALSIYDALAAALAPAEADGQMPAWAHAEARRLLEAAAVLHDIGYLVSYAAHHKHSYHLIVHDDLSGPGLFTPREVELIALIARYHRRAQPRRSHPAFGALPKADRKLVRRLAGILRLADGLDRTHTQSVASVRVSVGQDGPVVLTPEPALPGTDIETNRWGADDKRGLFERAFKRDVALKSHAV
jgi:exopolyphosphatase / guanosine-5'-triphosphate,3'-diphosphate pyrophosphatase